MIIWTGKLHLVYDANEMLKNTKTNCLRKHIFFVPASTAPRIVQYPSKVFHFLEIANQRQLFPFKNSFFVFSRFPTSREFLLFSINFLDGIFPVFSRFPRRKIDILNFIAFQGGRVGRCLRHWEGICYSLLFPNRYLVKISSLTS